MQEAQAWISGLGEGVVANSVEGSPHLLESRVRAGALGVLLAHCGTSQDRRGVSLMVKKLMVELQQINIGVTGKRTRHFENSLVHKVRQRIYQTYLLLAPVLEEQEAGPVVEELVEELLQHSQQTSVRYYCEWSLVVLLARHRGLQASMWAWLERAAKEKIGSVPSFLVVITQV